MTDKGAHQTAEQVVRTAYGRLLSILAKRTRDIAAAEDALSEALATALRVWPETGVPDRPEAWLLTTARRVHGHTERHGQVKSAAAPTLDLLYKALAASDQGAWLDERLSLLFVCAHPAIDEKIRTPLILQTVLGLDARRIAAAFLVSPEAMAQRLVRAKAKIRDAGLRFDLPDDKDRPGRARDVLLAIYAAYTAELDTLHDGEALPPGLEGEALFLARLCAGLLPEDPEALGLLALILYSSARTRARRGRDGQYVPLREQDRTLWDRTMIIEAEQALTAAARMGRFGRFQTEAAIQSLHVQAAITGRFEAAALLRLYDLLVDQHPVLGARIARAGAYGIHGDPARGLAMLDALPQDRIATHQPYWAARLDLLLRLGEHAGAAQALTRALALTRDPAVRAHLRTKASPTRTAGAAGLSDN